MSAYRPLNICRATTYFGLSGQVLASGYLLFYQAGTTTAQSVFGDFALSVNNGARVDLDSTGRPTVDVWADTADRYFVEWYDSADVKQYDVDDIEVPGGPQQVIPIPSANEFLSGDGTNLLKVNLANRLVPDPTGMSAKILGNNGTAPIWINKPADGAAGVSDIVIGSGSVKWSNGSSHTLQQYASDTVAGTSGLEVTKSVTFPTAYTSAPKVLVTVTGSNASAAGNVEVRTRITSITSTGFTVAFSNRTGGSSADGSGNGILTGTVSFNWEAIGPTAS